MIGVVHISAARVRELLHWDKTFEAIERAMASVTNNRAFQNVRLTTRVGDTPNVLLTMSGYLADEKYGGLGCKLLTYFPDNIARGQPPEKSNIFLMDEKDGGLKAIIEAVEVTQWRTAAASAVATKYLHGEESGNKNEILAIFGAGSLAKAHATAFQHFFNFKEVRIWNRTPERAKNLARELNENHADRSKQIFVACDNGEDCAKDADVIITATSGNSTILKLEWLNLEKSVHINGWLVKVNSIHWELEEAIYDRSNTYVDSWKGAHNELTGLKWLGNKLKGQIGDVITGFMPIPNPKSLTVFQSLGMAVEDCAMARMIYDLHLANP